jgi:hypothetical protein
MKTLEKFNPLLGLGLTLGLAAGLVACKPKEAQVDATQPLQQSFQEAEPAVRQTIAAVNTSLKAGQYQQAGQLLQPVITSRQLTAQQQQAVALTLQQLNQAVAKEPALDTKEMYELRNKMFQTLRKGSRF